jgi:hypothetical protein
LGGAAKNSFLDRSSYLDNSDFQLTSNGKLTVLSIPFQNKSL